MLTTNLNGRLFQKATFQFSRLTGKTKGAWHFWAYLVEELRPDQSLPLEYTMGNRAVKSVQVKFLPCVQELMRFRFFAAPAEASEPWSGLRAEFNRMVAQARQAQGQPWTGKIQPDEYLSELVGVLLDAEQRPHEEAFDLICKRFRQDMLYPAHLRQSKVGNWYFQTEIGTFFITEGGYIPVEEWGRVGL